MKKRKDYTIIQHIADISSPNNGWTKEINIVGCANREPVYELRSWNEGHTEMGNGITLTPNEMRKLKEVLNKMDLRCISDDMYCENAVKFYSVEGTDENAIENLSAFAVRIVKQHFDPIIGVRQNDYMIAKFQAPEAIKQQILDGCQYYIVKRGIAIIGFLAFYPKEGKMYLSKFYISQEYRGQGIARKMFEFLCKQTRRMELDTIFLNVNRNNDTVIAIYKHLGFQIVREEKNDIGNGFFMDDYVLECKC